MVVPRMIEVKELCKAFGTKQVLNGVTLTIPDGAFFGVYGKSGIGKSTLAKVLCGVVTPDSGTVLLDGKPLFSEKKGYDRLRGVRIQMVYQQPYAALDPRQKIGDGLIELIRYHRFAPKGKEKEGAAEALEGVGLGTEILSHLPHQVSGGEAQRVSIARCLLFQPELLILDEATSMLDVSTQANVLGIIRGRMRQSGGSVLMISHDAALTEAFCSEIYDFDQHQTRRTTP